MWSCQKVRKETMPPNHWEAAGGKCEKGSSGAEGVKRLQVCVRLGTLDRHFLSSPVHHGQGSHSVTRCPFFSFCQGFQVVFTFSRCLLACLSPDDSCCSVLWNKNPETEKGLCVLLRPVLSLVELRTIGVVESSLFIFRMPLVRMIG